MKKHTIILVAIIAIFTACNQSTEPIEYGKDNCHFCQMRIMDPKFGAEAVTQKGRTYKFDSAECLLHYLKETNEEHGHIVVTDYTAPKTFINASSSWFLVSQNMPSPMGGYLNAFADEATARSFQEKEGGKMYNWEEITLLYNK